MDGSRFDALSRALVTAHSRRGLTRLLSRLVIGGPLAILGLTETTAKRKKHKKKKRDGATAPPPASPPSPPPPESPPSPPPPCVPTSRAATCTGAPCGSVRTNNCGRTVSCDCTRGFNCLPNGTCARACSLDTQCDGCSGDVVCSRVNTEGLQHCVVIGGGLCVTFQPCNDTSECSRGTQCQLCTDVLRVCVPVSACTGDCAGADACLGGTGTCPGGGRCWQPLGGGPTRCGVIAPGSCGCTSDLQCEQEHGTGAFCVTFEPGGDCTCGTAQTTFCIMPA
jgi:hypothetical protein